MANNPTHSTGERDFSHSLLCLIVSWLDFFLLFCFSFQGICRHTHKATEVTNWSKWGNKAAHARRHSLHCKCFCFYMQHETNIIILASFYPTMLSLFWNKRKRYNGNDLLQGNHEVRLRCARVILEKLTWNFLNSTKQVFLHLVSVFTKKQLAFFENERSHLSQK